MNREQKAGEVKSLGEKLSRSSIAVVAEYRGMKVAELQELRKGLKAAGGDFQVVKNTLAKRSLAGTEFEPLSTHFVGPVGVALGPKGDPVAPAKAIEKFQKDFPNVRLSVKAAALQGKLLGAEDLKALAKLPGRDQLLSMLLSAMNGPARNFVSVLAAVPRDFVGVLDAVRRKKEEAGAA